MREWLHLSLLTACLVAGQAHGERRALVIGNNNYQHVRILERAVADATTMRKSSKGVGFTIYGSDNLTRTAFFDTLNGFTNQIQPHDEVMFYFSGHGVEIGGRNFLLPIDIRHPDDIRGGEPQVADEAVPLYEILRRIAEKQARYKLAIIDACRDNPLQIRFGRAVGSSKGLAGESGPRGTVVIYSASVGEAALDRLSQRDKDPNGVFMRVFKNLFTQPGQDILVGMQEVVIPGVLELTNDKQQPSIYVQGKGKFALLPVAGDSPLTQERVGTNQRKQEEPVPPVKPPEPPKEPHFVPTPPQPAPSPVATPIVDIPFVQVPGGTFQMGCGPWQSNCDDDEKPVHEVVVASFEMGKFEVTQGQWRAVMGNNPSSFKKGDNYPVETVSWGDSQKFIETLNGQGGRCTYRLPTEAEWEYACRSGGKSEKYCGGGDVGDLAWYRDNSGKKPHEVGKKRANGLGLHDMSGNVREWTCSSWANPYDGSEKNCANSGSFRVNRGGRWGGSPAGVRSAFRNGRGPALRYNDVGFRLARTCS